MCYLFEGVHEAGARTIDSELMHFQLKRMGYNQTKKAMNKWLREFFANEIGAGNIKEINLSHRVGWKGFKPKVAYRSGATAVRNSTKGARPIHKV